MVDKDNSDSDEAELRLSWDAYKQAWEVDRKRGILTKQDRGYLLGEVDVSGQDERNTRYRIRQRLHESLLDAILLSKVIPSKELEKVVQNEEIPTNSVISALLGLAYKITRLTSENVNDEFVRLIENAIRQQLSETEVGKDTIYEKNVDVEANLNVRETEIDTDEIISRNLEHGDVDDWTLFDVYFREKIQTSEGLSINKDAEPESVYIPSLGEEIGLHPILAKMVNEHKSN